MKLMIHVGLDVHHDSIAVSLAHSDSTEVRRKRVRVLLVEAVWRLLRRQPNWHARQKF